MDDRLRHLGGSFKNKTSKESDTNIRVNFENTSSLIKKNFNPMKTTVNSNEQFDLEREESKLFRFSGRFNVITASELNSGPYVSEENRPTDVIDWDPLFTEWLENGRRLKSPTNWVFQICYPFEHDYDFMLWGSRPVSMGMKVSNLTQSSTKYNNRNLLVIRTTQKNKLKVGDEIHLNDLSGGQYVGIHKVISLGDDGNELENTFTVDTTFKTNQPPPNPQNVFIKRVVGVSDVDSEFKNSVNVTEFKNTDLNGGSTNDDYLLVRGNLDSGVRVNDHVEFRRNTNGQICGLHLVLNKFDDGSFIIKPYTKPNSVNGYKFIKLDLTPSEYYVRKFGLITGSDYDTYPTAYGSSIYPESVVPQFGVANKTWSYHYNRDVNTLPLKNPRGGETTELKMCFLKRAGSRPYDWSNVTSHWDFNKSEAKTTNSIEVVSKNRPNTSGSIEKDKPIDYIGGEPLTDSSYVGDITEFNRSELTEKVITDVVFRFGLESGDLFTDDTGLPDQSSGPTRDKEGYYYKPFKSINVLSRSEIITTFNINEPYINVPNDIVLNPNDTFSWRKVLKPGIIEQGVNGVDWPFINGRHYVYSNDVVYIRRQNKKTNKVIDQSDVITIDTNLKC